ncbi:MAG: aminoglycoside phosphotransferase family protein [Eubacterium sp.]|nr:aminoglycoside phosphotransferase family protein [Eubacterium sp.]MBR4242175.1 aminoglycoside phosphotransferase family protein [Eubacterium sp.]
MEELREALSNFRFDGELVSVKEFGSGHINKTYIAKYKNGENEQKYVVQKVNNGVFKNVDELMDNVFAVTSYLRKKVRENGGDENRETLHFIKTLDGGKYYKCADGSFYRAYVFVKDSVSFDFAKNSDMFKSSGIAFGRFQKMLGDFNADSLYETIENFHNTSWRYENEFIPALEMDVKDRAKYCADVINFLVERKDKMGILVDLINEGKIPLRVTHNDTKLNNVMFDEKSLECVCVIDLDTVMPGLALYDFGDAIRFGANTAADDEKDLSKVSLNLEYFKAFAEGFLSECGDTLNQCEKDHLAFSAWLLTVELVMRFLTDYLNGDVYFKTEYSEHNLVRARNQMKLALSMEEHMEEMKDIIKSIR